MNNSRELAVDLVRKLFEVLRSHGAAPTETPEEYKKYEKTVLAIERVMKDLLECREEEKKEKEKPKKEIAA